MGIPVQKVPRCMSTQHPDNVQAPFFAADTVLGGEDEVQEAYYVFSHLGCDEQMWDCEGKEVDNFVVKKLLSRYESFFQETVLGKDVFLTLRVPNPTVEKAEAKILLETLESIPRSFDAASLFYGEEIPPIFEVILPMTASTRCIDRIYRYYTDFVVGKQHRPFREGDITIAEWIGEFKPRSINVIPLFEDWAHMLESASMVREYLRDKEVDYQRVFLARSDPAMNYGMISAVLLNKLALARLDDLSRELGIPILPIIGVGSAPFRGNLTPGNVDGVTREYPSAHTFTVQSSFKYDHPPERVIEAVRRLREREDGPPHRLDEERCLELAQRYTAAYQEAVTHLAPVINRVARFVPSRRKRKLHIGLFGYSRSVGEVSLPRAITFTAALYSLGLPPELLGLDALLPSDWEFLKGAYLNLEKDLADALRYFNPRSLTLLPEETARALRRMQVLGATDREPEHARFTDTILENLGLEREREMGEAVLRAAGIRRFLG